MLSLRSEQCVVTLEIPHLMLHRQMLRGDPETFSNTVTSQASRVSPLSCQGKEHQCFQRPSRFLIRRQMYIGFSSLYSSCLAYEALLARC